MKITEYPEATSLLEDDVLITDGANGTKKIAAGNLIYALLNDNPVMHRNIYRGKNLGTTVSSSQKGAISDGSFDDIWVGDYWTINGRIYRVIDIDYFYGRQESDGGPSITEHHLVIVPDKAMGAAQMNPTNTSKGGYPGSEMYSTGLSSAKSTINADFPNMVMTMKLCYPNEFVTEAGGSGSTGGWATSNAWYDISVGLMSAIMVSGPINVLRSAYDSYILYTGSEASSEQFAGFRLNPALVLSTDNKDYWFTDVANGYSFYRMNFNRNIAINYANQSHEIRPFFCIKG